MTPPKRGRPPLDPDDRLSTPVHVRLDRGQYDALCKLAAQTRSSVTALIRVAVRRELAADFRLRK